MKVIEPGSTGSGYALVTGGAGFVGCNVANRLLREGHDVVLLDDLSRPGVRRNVQWLEDEHGARVTLRVADVRDADMLRSAVAGADQVFHFAAQVAVTTSLDDPLRDFRVNAGGTLNLLEALRHRANPPPLVFASTNKVYGALEDVEVTLADGRYGPSDDLLRSRGLSERRPLDFHSPYGCSKGAADQYVVDYARTFGVPACVFRMSCIYGPRQFGNEDQGWVAHFLIRSRQGRRLTIFGDGRQVRDVLFVDDLVDAFVLARDHMGELAGKAFNVGGGPTSTLSLLDLLERITAMHRRPPEVSFDAWRPGDQRWYVSDTTRLQQAVGWKPRVTVEEGLERLDRWLATWNEAPIASTEITGLAEGVP